MTSYNETVSPKISERARLQNLSRRGGGGGGGVNVNGYPQMLTDDSEI